MSTPKKYDKFHISSQVFDTFRPLTHREKWDGIKGEQTSCDGFQFWERIKVTAKKNFLLASSSKEQQEPHK